MYNETLRRTRSRASLTQLIFDFPALETINELHLQIRFKRRFSDEAVVARESSIDAHVLIKYPYTIVIS